MAPNVESGRGEKWADVTHATAPGSRSGCPVLLVPGPPRRRAVRRTGSTGDQPDPDRRTRSRSPPPPGLDLPAADRPEPGRRGRPTGTADPAKVRRALAPLLGDADLGPHVLGRGRRARRHPLLRPGHRAGGPRLDPQAAHRRRRAGDASGPDHTFATRSSPTARAASCSSAAATRCWPHPRRPGRLPAPADVVTLARATAAQLWASGTTRVRLGYDATLFSGPDVNPHWPATYIPDEVVAPIQSLWVDEGRPADGDGRRRRPGARPRPTVFAAALAQGRRRGRRRPGRRARGPRRAAELAERRRAPRWPRSSSTPCWSATTRRPRCSPARSASRPAAPATFAGGAAAVLDAVDGLGVPTAGATAYDGSGLSRDNRLDPDTLTAVLDVAGAADAPELRAGADRAAGRGVHRVAVRPVRRSGRPGGPGPRAGQDRHPDRRQRAGRHGHRPRPARRWSSPCSPTRSRCSTPSTPGPRLDDIASALPPAAVAA